MELTIIFKLKSAVDIKVLVYLLRIANEDGDIYFTSIIRKKLANTLSISMQQVTNALVNLKKEEIIEGSRRQYKILL